MVLDGDVGLGGHRHLELDFWSLKDVTNLKKCTVYVNVKIF